MIACTFVNHCFNCILSYNSRLQFKLFHGIIVLYRLSYVRVYCFFYCNLNAFIASQVPTQVHVLRRAVSYTCPQVESPEQQVQRNYLSRKSNVCPLKRNLQLVITFDRTSIARGNFYTYIVTEMTRRAGMFEIVNSGKARILSVDRQ